MKNRQICLSILAGALLLSITLPGFTAVAAETHQKAIVQIKQNTKKVRQNIVKSFKDTKAKVRKGTGTVKQNIKKDFKTTKVKTKRGVHGFIQNIKNLFK
jgi:hypothetical protein